ncbi:unnamed protein product [Cylindrotheca closterium]|uniref:Uncharacterized protein n=1 Tax=Cylindrotheca closterium TaxID=2856 RepID=A0AAD2CDJ6_9STRA|nr:unnamed protein product [Cylindrotheca closterium]
MLSRNNLYAPLVAYEQTDVVPSAYMINQTSTPKAIQESSLVSFLQGISQDYHREEAMPNDPKNNGSRPTSLSDVQSKIRQRAVAIVGGQVTASMTSTTTGASTKNRKRKRKEISWNDIEEIVKRQTIAIPSMPSRIGSIEFLRELNARWNEYIRSALQLNNSANDTSAIMSRFAALREDVELVGAHVRIGSCSQRKGLTSCYGVVVSERKKTWAVATLQSQRKQKKKGVSNTEKEEVGGDQNVDMLVVPKRGTTLILVVPLRHTEKDAPRTSTLVDDEEIISLSQRSICIVLNGSESNYS